MITKFTLKELLDPVNKDLVNEIIYFKSLWMNIVRYFITNNDQRLYRVLLKCINDHKKEDIKEALLKELDTERNNVEYIKKFYPEWIIES